MQMTRGMRLDQAKAHVAERLGVSTAELSDPLIMHDSAPRVRAGTDPRAGAHLPERARRHRGQVPHQRGLRRADQLRPEVQRAHRPPRRRAAGRRERASDRRCPRETQPVRRPAAQRRPQPERLHRVRARTTSTSPRSRCSSAPACSSRPTRRSTSSPTAAASSTARRTSCASRRTWSKTPSARRPARSCSAAASPRTTSCSSRAASPSPTSARASGSSTRGPASTATRRSRTSPTSPASTTTSATSTRYEIAVGAKDVPPETCAVHNAEAQYLNTTKPIGIGPLSRIETVAIFQMAAEIVGGDDELRRRPIVYNGVCPVSPLKLPHDATEVIIESAALVDPQQHPEHGDGRRLVAGHAGRHAGHPQRRGALAASRWRSSPSAARRASTAAPRRPWT